MAFQVLACLYLADGAQEKCQKSLDKALTGKVAQEKVRIAPSTVITYPPSCIFCSLFGAEASKLRCY